MPTPKLQAGEQRAGKPDVFGSLSLFQVLSSRVDNATALSAADAWDGDSMITFTRNGPDVHAGDVRRQGHRRHEDDHRRPCSSGRRRCRRARRPSTAPRDTVTLTACDPGAAASAIPNKPIASLDLPRQSRRSLRRAAAQWPPDPQATCASDTLVRDPAFAPLIDAAGIDPTAEPDPAVVTALQARVREIAAECRQT